MGQCQSVKLFDYSKVKVNDMGSRSREKERQPNIKKPDAAFSTPHPAFGQYMFS